MTIPTSEVMTQIVERLTGATGEPDRVLQAARAYAERCMAQVVPELEQTFPVPVRVECSEVALVRFASSRPAPGGFGAMTVAAAHSSPDALLMTLDAEAVAVAICALFGGDEDLPAIPVSRALSSIELEVSAQLFELVASAFNGSGDRALGLRFPLPAPLSGEQIDKRVIRDGPAARMTFDLILGQSRGRLSVTLPQRVLMEHRGDTSSDPSSQGWKERFSEEVMRSAVALNATIPLEPLTLGDIGSLRVGQVLELPPDGPRQVLLSARDQTLFLCEFGKLGQNYTVRVLQPFDATQDFVKGLLTA